MEAKSKFVVIFIIMGLLATLSCQPTTVGTGKTIVATYSVLGSVVKELVGDAAEVTVSIPDGLDPHEFEPSAKDIEAINKADLVIENGLGLEEGWENTLETARENGGRFFTAADYITVRHVDPEEVASEVHHDEEEAHHDEDEHHHEAGAPDPHLWLDPANMKSIVAALVPVLTDDLGLDVSAQAADLGSRLDTLNTEVAGILSVLPQEDRKLVTGHESMGYFAERYGFKLVGMIVPGLSSQAEVSAANLAALKQAIAENDVKAIFTELGTSPAVASTIADETGVKVVELNTHALPADGSYFTFMKDIATTIVNALE